MRTHTLRGRIAGNTKSRLIVDDGRFNHALVVKEFYIFAKDGVDDPQVVLALSETNVGSEFDASNSNQIGWGIVAQSNTQTTYRSIIYPDHVIVGDLVISNVTAVPANYLIVLESKTISDDEAILQLIKERSQNVS